MVMQLNMKVKNNIFHAVMIITLINIVTLTLNARALAHAQNYNESGREQFFQGNYESALTLYNNTLAQDPDDGRVHY